jgi:N-acetylmuramic acid 6-phosphate etherase
MVSSEGGLPETEGSNPRSAGLDLMATAALVELLVDEQYRAVDAVAARSAEIAEVVDAIVERMERGGRLHYVGAGTSGRIATLDAAEMPPTFGTDPSLVSAHVAGGADALMRAIEGAEDDESAGKGAMRDVLPDDAVIGLSASGGAGFVIAAIARARKIGAYTVAIVNSEGSPLADAAGVAIVLATGPEPLTGSTRLKAGTSQKIVLNAISTAVMVRLGKVHDHLMVDVVATNEKLRRRALRLVRTLTGAPEAEARALLDAAGGRVKVAAVMHGRGIDAERAIALLEGVGGSLRPLL